MVVGYMDHGHTTITDTTQSDLNNSTVEYIISTRHYDDYESRNINDEEIQDTKSSWHNPRAINAPKKYINSQIRTQTRNQLPYKYKIDNN
jgi:hypothetical protein